MPRSHDIGKRMNDAQNKAGSMKLPPHLSSSTLVSVASVVDPERRHRHQVGIVKTPPQLTAVTEMENPPPSLLPSPCLR
ncbi:hypothetical protein Y032_0089g2231 [Ancylostoma ceylanicum]|uniref:Uncharacterized protein n=1 Tax=Ancylostoma ceylanicum TaxID=53326 RepID=A0A016TMD6_9BILA|nr:hypothetical protein Y032_0089g2231 [Ancylostoma ceylanicum]